MSQINTHQTTQTNDLRFTVNRVILAVFVIAVICVPLLKGFFPKDDTLRDVANALSMRPWDEVTVLADQFTMDHNYGWHRVLHLAHVCTGMHQQGLVYVAVLSLVLLAFVPPLLFVRRPEVWSLFALLLLFMTGVWERYLSGRPLVFSMAVEIHLLFLCHANSMRKPLVFFTALALFASATFLHGLWYVFVLIPIALALTRRLQDASLMTVAWLMGSLGGAAMTGEPFRFLFQQVNMGIHGTLNDYGHLLDLELLPNPACLACLAIPALILFIRKRQLGSIRSSLRNPAFWLFIVATLLSVKGVRFFVDWALPALAVWLYYESQDYSNDLSFGKAVGFIAALGLAVFFLIPDRKYPRVFVDIRDPQMQEWLPEKSGVLLSRSMHIFYETLYRFPDIQWRFAPGYEPMIMPPPFINAWAELHKQVSSQTIANAFSVLSTKDRLLLFKDQIPAKGPPSMTGIEWKEFGNFWLARKQN